MLVVNSSFNLIIDSLINHIIKVKKKKQQKTIIDTK